MVFHKYKYSQEGAEILRAYRDKLADPKMGMLYWRTFLDGDYFDVKNDKCLVCGKKVKAQFCGSHFRQTNCRFKQHQLIVAGYDRLLRQVFESIIKKYGYRLKDSYLKSLKKENKHHRPIWEATRLTMRDGLYRWDDAVEKIKEEKII